MTYDASPEAGAAVHCRSNTRNFFKTLLANGGRSPYRQELAATFKLCQVPQSAEEVENVAYWVQVSTSLFGKRRDMRSLRVFDCFFALKRAGDTHAVLLQQIFEEQMRCSAGRHVGMVDHLGFI